MPPLTREEFIDHLSALERRVSERLDLLERLIALGFDDTSDWLRMRFGTPTEREEMRNLTQDN